MFFELDSDGTTFKKEIIYKKIWIVWLRLTKDSLLGGSGLTLPLILPPPKFSFKAFLLHITSKHFHQLIYIHNNSICPLPSAVAWLVVNVLLAQLLRLNGSKNKESYLIGETFHPYSNLLKNKKKINLCSTGHQSINWFFFPPFLYGQWPGMEWVEINVRRTNPTNKWFNISRRFTAGGGDCEGSLEQYVNASYFAGHNNTVSDEKRWPSINIWTRRPKGKWL